MPSQSRKQTKKRAARPRLAPSHVAILQLGVSIWNQWRANEPLTRPNLRNADLSGLHLENVNLCRADLRGANLSNAYLYEADFQEADLRRANLTRAGLIGANFHRAILTSACLQQTYLSQSDLSNANLTSSDLRSADLQSAILTHAVLTRASIAEADLSDSFDLTAAQLTETKDANLAYFSDGLRLQIGLPPSVLESEVLVSTENSTATGHMRSAASSKQSNQSIEVFQPARATASERIAQPTLRKLISF